MRRAEGPGPGVGHRRRRLAPPADADLDVYFCDPHSAWQRGTNENTNGLLPQYFPKGADLHRHSPSHRDAVAATLNSRPRKTLGWRTPAEALTEHLHSLTQMQRCDDPFEPGLAAAVGRDTTGFVCSVGSRTVVSFRVGCFV